MNTQTRLPPAFFPAGIVGRIVTALIAMTCAVVGMFFFAFVLLVAGVLAAIIAIRVWWVFRKIRAERDKHVIEGAYSIESVRREAAPLEGVSTRVPPAL